MVGCVDWGAEPVVGDGRGGDSTRSLRPGAGGADHLIDWGGEGFAATMAEMILSAVPFLDQPTATRVVFR
jgi:hypothetical protein